MYEVISRKRPYHDEVCRDLTKHREFFFWGGGVVEFVSVMNVNAREPK